MFAPKYRRKVFYVSKRLEIGQILRQLGEWKGIVCNEILKGKSNLIIYSKWANMRFQYRNSEFWCRGYHVYTVGKNTKKIKEYIANQLKEEQLNQQMKVEDFDPFKG